MEHDGTKKTRFTSKPRHRHHRYLVPLQSALGPRVVVVT